MSELSILEGFKNTMKLIDGSIAKGAGIFKGLDSIRNMRLGVSFCIQNIDELINNLNKSKKELNK